MDTVTSTKAFDLKKCLGCMEQTYTKKFGKKFQFGNMEALFDGLKGISNPITYRMIKRLTSRKYWIFEDYWLVPSFWKLWRDLKKTKGLFQDLPDKEQHATEVLYDIFKNIEVASIILRFIDPQNFGVISPPVRYALRQSAKETYVEEYLDYLSTLRSYTEEYGFERVADADMALWALMENCVIPRNSSCDNFKGFQKKRVDVEEEYIKKSMLFKGLEDDLLSVAEEDVEKKVKTLKEERDKMRKELDGLQYKLKIYPVGLIELKKSPLPAEEKFIHDRREQYIDSGQEIFLNQLAKNPYIHKVIWSENITSKPPTRISHVEDAGELTILYVTKNNYTAKIKVLPCECADGTHAKYFASLISDHMQIPNMSGKTT